MEQHLRTLEAAIHRLTQEVFDELDPRLQATALLAAVSHGDGDERTLLVTPEGVERDPEVVAKAASRGAKRFRKAGGEGLADVVEARWLAAKALRGALQDLFAAGDGRLGTVGPVRTLGGWEVLPILRLEAALYHTHYQLRNRGEETATLPTSLLDAAVMELLQAAATAVSDYDPRRPPGIGTDGADEILRAAGRRLMAVPATAAGGEDGPLFSAACDALATLPYEGDEGLGRILVAARGHPDVETVLLFHEPLDLLDRRGVRKVLELAEDDLCLLTDASVVFGLGRALDSYDPPSESRFEIAFLGRSAWELAHGDARLMRVVNGLPELAEDPIDEEEFGDALQRTFGGVAIEAFERLLRIALEAARQRHGTTVVITGGARQEALRLGAQSLRIHPLELTTRTVGLVSGIDGALLVDPEGVCHAIGVILDGSASNRGDPARGARFNSAVRYVDEGRHPCLALVISGDGTVDLIAPV
jgi:hypothetical protein